MAGDVTITGGSTHAPYDLGFNTADRAYLQAQALAGSLSTTCGSQQNNIFGQAVVTPGGLIISPATQHSTSENLKGFAGIGIQNTTYKEAVLGGGVANQSIVAGMGGLTFVAGVNNAESLTNTSIAALGGNNNISFQYNSGTDSAFTSTGNDTITAGDGADTISAGARHNLVNLGSGTASVLSGGTDTVNTGSGFSTISVDSTAVGASVLINEAAFLNAGTGQGNYSLVFNNGAAASTLFGGGRHRADPRRRWRRLLHHWFGRIQLRADRDQHRVRHHGGRRQ